MFQISEINITEHIEGDETKFALWTGSVPISDYRIILKVGGKVTMSECVDEKNFVNDPCVARVSQL